MRTLARLVRVDGPHATSEQEIHVFKCLGITRHSPSLGDHEIDVEEFHDIEGLSEAQLLDMTKNVLMDLCQQRGLSRTGNKQTVVKCLFQHETHAQDPGICLLTCLNAGLWHPFEQ